ncbi:hypothetical protein UZ36_01755 [Candidatus Nitromaritima sp. SCGC AAA799-C22]|nr:hypothetical protein UZ36_01755 [Candidatus Nitromaritima sp. SCGC AAA799-C22]
MLDDGRKFNDGDTICVVGGGPGGSACAIKLKMEADKQGKSVNVVIMEHKKFAESRHYNQCIGVLSPPLESILRDELNLEIPRELIRKEIDGYCLHSDRLNLNLEGEEHGRTYAVDRNRFDDFMLDAAQQAGAVVLHNRATGIEINHEDVMIYSEGENCKASAVVGAFGLDDGTCRIFEHGTRYRQPDFLNTIITQLKPGEEFLAQLGSTIHAFLLSHKGFEFGAVTPKQDHMAINIAGRNVSSKVMLEFLRSGPVQRFLPPHKRREKPLNYFKGKFPISPARNLFGDRYVTIGDAAGLIRPFKGKGINSACITGIYAARSIVNHGVSRQAFAENFYRDCREMTGDVLYGRGVRIFTNLCARFKFMDHLLAVAAQDPVFMEAMFDSVSGHKPYKEILLNTISISLAVRMVWQGIHRLVLAPPAGAEPDPENSGAFRVR